MARKNVSNRVYQKADGTKSVGPDASGKVIYQLLAADGKKIAKEFTLDSSTPAAALFMLAQFGFVTKVGNVANSVLNGDDPGTVDDAAQDITEFLGALFNAENPMWREPGEGRARGPKYDKDVLAAVIWEGRSEDKRTGNFATVESVRTYLEDKSFYAKARNNTAVMAAYYARMAEKTGEDQTVSPDDLG